MRSSQNENSVIIEGLWRWLQRQPKIFLSGLIILVYIALGFALEFVADYYKFSSDVEPWDPAAGWHIVLLFGFGLRYIPAVFLVPFLEKVVLPGSSPHPFLSGLASGLYISLGYGIAVALLLRKLDIDPCLRQLRDIVWFTGVLAIASSLISCLSITTSGLLGNTLWSDWFNQWMHDWAGELTGIMMLAPPLLILMRALPWSEKHLTLQSSAPRLTFESIDNKEILEWIILIAATVLCTWLAFGGIQSNSIEYSYVAFVPLIWIAVRHGFEKTTIITMIVNICAVIFVGVNSQGTNILALQFGLMTVTFTAVLLSAYVKDRLEEIARRQKLEQKLRYDATHDDLTGLRNRTWLWAYLEQTMEKARKNENYLFALLFLDLDRFKNINDSLGHLVGDRLLVAVGERIKSCVPNQETAARFGGDEFIILLDEVANLNEVKQTAQQLCQDLSQEYKIDEYNLVTTVSMGIAPSCLSYQAPEELLRDADIALYEAKARGKAQVVIFDRQMYESVSRRSLLENDLRQAIEDLDDE